MALALPLAIVAAALAAALTSTDEFGDASRTVTALVPALAGATLGALWTGQLAREPRGASAHWLRFAGSAWVTTVVTAVIMCVGLSCGGGEEPCNMIALLIPIAAVVGAIVGVVVAVPALSLVFAAHVAALEARPDTAARASASRRVWLVVGAVVAIVASIVGRDARHHVEPAWVTARWLGGSILTVVATLDLVAFARLRRLGTGLERASRDRPTSPGATAIDLGVGEEAWVAPALPHRHPYRAEHLPELVVRGDLPAVKSAHVRRAALSVVVAIAALTAFATVGTAAQPRPPALGRD
ncbi:MAG TPA: hypothetical protein VGM56_28630 [Byssovorax sp.]